MKVLLSSLGVGVWVRRLLGIRLGRLSQYHPQPLSIAELAKTDDGLDLPSISLVTPSFNQARFVRQTIDSVVHQNYPKLQYVVQDAESNDGTGEILKSYAGKGVEVFIEADEGQADALNRGFDRTSGEIMGYLNSDDMILPGTLHLVGRYFRDNPSVDVIYGNRLVINENGMEIGRWILPKHDSDVLRFVDYVPQETMFWRRRIWDRVGAQFDAKLQFAIDWDLILRFIDNDAVFQHLSQLFGIFRAHDKQKSQTDFVIRGSIEMRRLRMRHADQNLSGFQRVVHHLAYLFQHRRADAAFEVASLNKAKNIQC